MTRMMTCRSPGGFSGIAAASLSSAVVLFAVLGTVTTAAAAENEPPLRGREWESAEIGDILMGLERQALVYGPEKCGMSALIKRGVVPYLESPGTLPIVVSAQSPKGAMEQTLDALEHHKVITRTERQGDSPLTLPQRTKDRQLCFLVDDAQLLLDSRDGQEYLTTLAKAIRSTRHISAGLFVTAGTPLESIRQFELRFNRIYRHFSVPGLGREAAEQIVRDQLERGRVTVANTVVTQLLKDQSPARQQVVRLTPQGRDVTQKWYSPAALIEACRQLRAGIDYSGRRQIRMPDYLKAARDR